MVLQNEFEGFVPVGAVGSNNPYPVQPYGFFLGIMGAGVLYGIHASQIHRYFTTSNEDSRGKKLFVCWIFTLSTLQIMINWGAGTHYFANGLVDPKVWSAMHWTLSFQDGLVPTMAATCQYYFSQRAYTLSGKKVWLKAVFLVLVPLTWTSGIVMAILSFFWARDPFEGSENTWHRRFGKAADHFPVVWMGLSALLDGLITVILVLHFVRAKTAFKSTRRMLRRALALTLETVFLTHLVGMVMVILFLWNRTSTNAFWILLELVTELYALSVLFTLNSRQAMRQSFAGTRGGLKTIPMTQPAAGGQPVHVELRAGVKQQEHDGSDSGHFESDDLERGSPASNSADEWSTVQVDVV